MVNTYGGPLLECLLDLSQTLLEAKRCLAAHGKAVVESTIDFDRAEIRLATGVDSLDEAPTQVVCVVSSVLGHLIAEEVAEQGQCNPDDDVVGVASTANLISVVRRVWPRTHESLRVVGRKTGLCFLDGDLDGVDLVLKDSEHIVRQYVLRHLILYDWHVELSCGVDEGFFENGFGLDAVREVEPLDWIHADGAVEVLACGQEGGLDCLGDDVCLEGCQFVDCEELVVN